MARDDPHGRLRAVRVSPVPVSEFPVTTCRRSCSAREARAVRRPYTSKPLSPLPSFLASVIEGRTHHRLPIAAIIEAASGPFHQFPAAAAPSGFRGNGRPPSDGQAARGLSIKLSSDTGRGYPILYETSSACRWRPHGLRPRWRFHEWLENSGLAW